MGSLKWFFNKVSHALADDILFAIFLLVINVILDGLILWSILACKIALTSAEEILLLLCVYIWIVVLEMYFYVAKIWAGERRERGRWVIQQESDNILMSIRDHFYQIIANSYGSKDLFVAHFMKQSRQLERLIKHVADRHELAVKAEHFLSVDNVLDAFQGDPERIWRYTWAIDGEGKLFDNLPWKRYFEKTSSMLDAGQISEIRILLVVDSFSVIDVPRVKKLLDFFRANKGHGCFIVDRKTYQSICSDDSTVEVFLDFGIYGNRLLFLTQTYEPDISGIFSKDAPTIEHFKKTFDAMWGSNTVAKPNPSKATGAITWHELHAFDDA